MKPAATIRPRAEMTRVPERASDEIAAIRPLVMPMLRTASRLVSGSTTRPPSMTTSYVWAEARHGNRIPASARKSRFICPSLQAVHDVQIGDCAHEAVGVSTAIRRHGDWPWTAGTGSVSRREFQEL